MPQPTIELLNKAAQATSEDIYRKGNVIHLPAVGSVIMTGDLHGHRRNFERVVSFSDLPNNPDTHVILHEIIHGGPEDAEGGCLSYQLLFDVARYKLQFPKQVHTVMGNHDTACISNSEVMKGGKEMNRAMHAAIKREFAEDAEDVVSAIRQFLFSQALAVRCGNRIWFSHSLPSDRLAEEFDPEVLDRPLEMKDVARPGAAYILVWGRRHSQALLDELADLFDIDLFVLGHQPQEKGCCQAGENLIILACDHNHGCVLPIDLTRSYTVEQLSDSIVQLVSIA